MSAFFIVLLGGSSTTSPLVDVTGVSATGEVGLVAAGSAQIADVSGVSASAVVSPVLAFSNSTTTLSGVFASTYLGNAIALSESDVVVSGVSGVTAFGAVDVLGSSSILLTGVSGTAILGQAGFTESTSFSVNSVSSFANVGNVFTTSSANISSGSVFANGSIGSVQASGTQTVLVTASGVQATGQVSSVVASTSDAFLATMMEAYSWDDSLGFGAKFPPPSVSIGVNGQALKPRLSGETIRYLAIAGSGATGDTVRVYQIDGINGWGSSQTMASSSIGATGVSWLSFGSPTEEWLFSCNGVYGSLVTGRLRAKKFVNGAFSGTTQIATAQNLEATSVAAVNITSSLRTAVVGLQTTPFIRAHDFTTSFTGNTSSPSTLPPAYVNAVTVLSVSTSSDPRAVVFAAHQSSPYVSAYRLNYDSTNNRSSFGTKYSNPSSLPPNTGREVAISPNGSLLAVAHDSSPYVSVYPWNTSSGFGAKYANPATLPTSTGLSVSWRNNNILAVGQFTSPYLNVYNFNNGFGARFSNPTTLPSTAAYAVTLS